LQRYRALQIQSEIYVCFNKSPGSDSIETQTIVAQLCQKLADWKEASSQLPNKALIESEWLMGRMLLLRPCRFLPNRTMDELNDLWKSATGFIVLYRRLVESNSIFYVQIACEKVYWTGLMALYSYCKLRRSTAREYNKLRPLDVWVMVKDVISILRALSERWEQGKLVCGRFDVISTRILELSEAASGENMAVEFPAELQNLDHYTSLTVVWASNEKVLTQRKGDAQDTNDLRQLVSEML
jgi:hypothetical protein